MFAPEPLSEPLGNEVIQLPKAPLVVGEGKVIAPTTGHLVDLSHDFTSGSPGGVAIAFVSPRWGWFLFALLPRALPWAGMFAGLWPLRGLSPSRIR